jgi:hypothetical protein
VKRACRSMSPTLDPDLTTPSGRFHTFWHSNSLGPWGLPSSLRPTSICIMDYRNYSLLNGLDRSSTVTVFREGVRHRSILIAFGEAEIAPSPYANDRYATPHYAAKPW